MGILVISYYRTLAPGVLASLAAERRPCTSGIMHLGNCAGFNLLRSLREQNGIAPGMYGS
jgi:hypothetical protein